MALGVILLLAGCSAPSSEASTPARHPSSVTMGTRAPDSGPVEDIDATDLLTIDPIGFGLRPDDRPGRLVRWATRYCQRAGLTPCTGIADRGVALCIEAFDCRPALLVPFDQGVAAFLSGGPFPAPTVHAVWRRADDLVAARLGGAHSILEAHLRTFGVCRDQGGGYPRGPACPLDP